MSRQERATPMKVGILAGGFGTRIAEETERIPKPMVEIGGKPIMWHIMRYFYQFGFSQFAVALGYKADYIKRWFVDYSALSGDLHLQLGEGRIDGVAKDIPKWDVSLIETGIESGTGGRIKQLMPHMGEGTFIIALGDGLSTIDLHALMAFHKSHDKLATLAAVRPPARFGHLEMVGDDVVRFDEKPQTGEGWINAGYFILEPEVGEYIADDATMFELEPLQRLAADGELKAFKHEGFWQPMDTLRDKKLLERYWEAEAPWKIW